MRAIKTTIISILALGLLAGSAVGVTAQEGRPADPADIDAYVTGTIAVSAGECTEAEAWVECPLSLDASDSRLSGEGSVRSAGLPRPTGMDPAFVLVAQSLRVANDGGAWTGGGRLYAVMSPDPVGQDETMWVLTGEGGYGGLTAVLRVDFGEEGSFGGVIAGAEPPAPPVPEAE